MAASRGGMDQCIERRLPAPEEHQDAAPKAGDCQIASVARPIPVGVTDHTMLNIAVVAAARPFDIF